MNVRQFFDYYDEKEILIYLFISLSANSGNVNRFCEIQYKMIKRTEKNEDELIAVQPNKKDVFSLILEIKLGNNSFPMKFEKFPKIAKRTANQQANGLVLKDRITLS
ncbi:hypothetical protein BpHYR1_053836 [Brachionus plicatilis]|uniref:Uncharacterized protein n=1 Tax=Brachionus plicatilis TaxID=10195 RepID=A0A3M7R5L0_BRAPC|nr:hypothetical protein BpHYR1_053836 [Brachionus plicatilis]